MIGNCESETEKFMSNISDEKIIHRYNPQLVYSNLQSHS